MSAPADLTATEFEQLCADARASGYTARGLARELGCARSRVDRALARYDARKASEAREPAASDAPPTTAMVPVFRKPPPVDPAPPDVLAGLHALLHDAVRVGDHRAITALTRALQAATGIPGLESTVPEADLSGLTDPELEVVSLAGWLAAGRPEVDAVTRRGFDQMFARMAPPATPARGRAIATAEEVARAKAGDLSALPPGHPLNPANAAKRCGLCHCEHADRRVCGDCLGVAQRLRDGLPVVPGGQVIGRLPERT